MRTAATLLGLALVVGVAHGAAYTDYTWDGSVNNWSDGSHWSPAGPPAASTDRGIIASGEAIGDTDLGTPLTGYPLIRLDAGGVLVPGGNTYGSPGGTYNVSFSLNGGQMGRAAWFAHAQTFDFNGLISVDGAGSSIIFNRGQNWNLLGGIAGTEMLTVTHADGGKWRESFVQLTLADSSFSGGWTVQGLSAFVYGHANRALGNGDITVKTRGNVAFSVTQDYSAAPRTPALILDGGTVWLNWPYSGSIISLPFAITVEAGGGSLTAGDGIWGGTFTGDVTLNGNLTLEPRRLGGPTAGPTYSLTGKISGDGGVIVFAKDRYYGATGVAAITNAANDFKGGVTIQSGYLIVAAEGAFGTGPITVNNPESLSRLTLLKASGAADWTLKNNLGGDGIITVEDGSGSYKLTAQGSTVAPGNSAGTLTVQGGFAFAKNGLKNAKLSIELVGVTAGDPPVFSVQNDQLAVTGDVTGLANANLEVGLFNLTVADLAGKTFTILTCGNDLSGGGDRFASVVYPSMAGAGLGGPISYNNGSIDIQVTYLGDADMSGTVTFTDYQMLEASFGVTTGATWAMGDFDGDGDVDFTDYQILESNFGSPVPEPATLALLAVGAAGLIRRR